MNTRGDTTTPPLVFNVQCSMSHFKEVFYGR
nr:MAG TPA: hypothetical protein [Inoviridae sp.]